MSREPDRIFFDRSLPFFVDATEITVHIPFNGDPGMFDVRPTTFNTNIASGDVVDHELRLICTISQEGMNPASLIDREIQSVKTHLEWLRPSEKMLRDALDNEMRALVATRKQSLARHSSVLGSLGIPIRQAATAAPVPAVPKPKREADLPKASAPTYLWDVFLSHASEDKEAFARPIAEALRSKGLKVWFDEFTLRVGDSLRESIDRGLAGSRFGIVILSKAFFNRHWTTQELNGLTGLEVKRRKVILPVWFGVGRDDVQQFSPILADRVAARSEQGFDQVISQLLAATNPQD